jgi:hypothetical protein
MAIELVCVKTKDNGVTSEDINRFKLSLERMRVLRDVGFQNCRLNVLTDDKEGLDEDIRVIPYLGNDKITNPAFTPIELHNYDDFFGGGTKVMYFSANFIARDLTGGFCFDGIPDKGTTHETTHKFTAEEITAIQDGNLSFLQLSKKWWANDSTYSDAYFGFIAGDTRDLYRKFMQDPEGYQEKYDNFADFYENEFDGFILPVIDGLIGGYYVDDVAKNKEVNDFYEERVRPIFTENPNNWRGLGGEPEAKFIEFNHEYRDITKQCSLLLLERGEDNKDPFTDRFLHLWVL